MFILNFSQLNHICEEGINELHKTSCILWKLSFKHHAWRDLQLYFMAQGLPDYWLSGLPPACPRVNCGVPQPTPGSEYGKYLDTKYQSSFFFGCQDTFKLAGQTNHHDNVVR
jgi:hypothetical protein